MNTDLHVVKGRPDADELAAVAKAFDLVRARAQEVTPVSRWRTSLHRKPDAARRPTTWAQSLRVR
jgi:hypothetical protein